VVDALQAVDERAAPQCDTPEVLLDGRVGLHALDRHRQGQLDGIDRGLATRLQAWTPERVVDLHVPEPDWLQGPAISRRGRIRASKREKQCFPLSGGSLVRAGGVVRDRGRYGEEAEHTRLTVHRPSQPPLAAMGA